MNVKSYWHVAIAMLKNFNLYFVMVSRWQEDFFVAAIFVGILGPGEPLEVQLRHLAQVALEGRDSEPSRHEVECQAPGGNIFGETFDDCW